MDKKEFALKQHEDWKGKIEVISRAKIQTPENWQLLIHRELLNHV